MMFINGMKAVGSIQGGVIALEEAGQDQFVVHAEDQSGEYITVELDREAVIEWIGVLQKAVYDTKGE